jgi:hypothetical protein
MNKIVSFILLFLFVQCFQNPTNSNNSKKIVNFPLAIGNHWTYASTSSPIYSNTGLPASTWTDSIIGDTIIMDKRYFIYKMNFSNYFIFIRNDDSGNVLRYFADTCKPWLKFNADSQYDYGSSTGFKITVKRNQPVRVFRDSILNCTEFYYDSPSYIDDEFYEYYALGIGLVSISGQAGGSYLVSYFLKN